MHSADGNSMANGEVQRPEWLLQMESILESLNEGVVIVDDALRVLFVNEVLLNWGGYQSKDILGRTPADVFPPEDLAYLSQQYAKAQRYGHNRHEFYFPRKDGGKIPAIYSGRLIVGPDGRQYSLLTIVNISEQKRVEEQLRQANSWLQQRQREIESELKLAGRVQ